ncbi:hypothetical protein [Neomicrococcus aestuarii]|uniref:Serine/threonine protein kinase HipA of HipAB toxin-antitoxin module n=1 Tax=Neomicrococcus aestuarii TaxID=556325 RepID=A0A1L2ZPQ6_9MICC|nr:hypothetical protein [Neomicrococcus aestuarii]APF41170.1 hypothetical protein BHE16_09375 [Neomicrococcus aestuarii]MBB5513032.1 serine/threonine protein kinase HipA of HipAB toxin-antitoxin module [Neomicrococcus aestuarii]
MLFDGLIGNTDRHSNNWAIEVTLGKKNRLAPSFDHATAMAITSRGARREKLLAEPQGIFDFAVKARARQFEDGQSKSLVDYAAGFSRQFAPGRLSAWASKLEALRDDVIESLIQQSQMSGPAAKLASEIIKCNRERIVECH